MRHLLPLVLLAGCARSGLSEATSQDIIARMETARPTITECYAQALKIDRKLRGMIVLRFEAAASSGQFSNVTVLRDDMGDTPLQTCVIEAVTALRLSKPQKSKLAVTYPLDFAPVK
jgi:hypothetical protein